MRFEYRHASIITHLLRVDYLPTRTKALPDHTTNSKLVEVFPKILLVKVQKQRCEFSQTDAKFAKPCVIIFHHFGGFVSEIDNLLDIKEALRSINRSGMSGDILEINKTTNPIRRA